VKAGRKPGSVHC